MLTLEQQFLNLHAYARGRTQQVPAWMRLLDCLQSKRINVADHGGGLASFEIVLTDALGKPNLGLTGEELLRWMHHVHGSRLRERPNRIRWGPDHMRLADEEVLRPGVRPIRLNPMAYQDRNPIHLPTDGLAGIRLLAALCLDPGLADRVLEDRHGLWLGGLRANPADGTVPEQFQWEYTPCIQRDGEEFWVEIDLSLALPRFSTPTFVPIS